MNRCQTSFYDPDEAPRAIRGHCWTDCLGNHVDVVDCLPIRNQVIFHDLSGLNFNCGSHDQDDYTSTKCFSRPVEQLLQDGLRIQSSDSQKLDFPSNRTCLYVIPKVFSVRSDTATTQLLLLPCED